MYRFQNRMNKIEFRQIRLTLDKIRLKLKL